MALLTMLPKALARLALDTEHRLLSCFSMIVCRPPESASASRFSRSTSARMGTRVSGRRAGGVQRGEGQQVVDDALHARGLLLHHREVVALALRIELELAHRLEKADQHGERRAQLVRHVGHEVAPHRLDARPA